MTWDTHFFIKWDSCLWHQSYHRMGCSESYGTQNSASSSSLLLFAFSKSLSFTGSKRQRFLLMEIKILPNGRNFQISAHRWNFFDDEVVFNFAFHFPIPSSPSIDATNVPQ